MKYRILIALFGLMSVPVHAKPLPKAEVMRLVDLLGLGNADHSRSVRMDFAPVQNMLLLSGVHCSLFVVHEDTLLQKLPTRYTGSYCRIKAIAFHDLDADGDKDMLVLSESRTGGAGEFMYFDVADGYRNTGSPETPFEHLPQWADGSDASKGIQKVLRWAKKNPMK